jgi:hypothetical protein
MLTVTPQDICPRAIGRFGHGTPDDRRQLFNWLSGINFAFLHCGPCHPYIERLNGRIFDIPADEFAAFAKDALDSVEGEQP